MIYKFLRNYKYNIVEKVQFKDLCKIKQLPNQSLSNFMKEWKLIANKIYVFEQDLKDTFANSLLPMYKLHVISNHGMILFEMIDVLLKNEAYIKESCKKKYKKSNIYENKEKYQVQENEKKIEVTTANIDRKRNKP